MLRVVTAPSDPPEGLSVDLVLHRLDGADDSDSGRVQEIVRDLTAEAERLSAGRWVYAEYEERITTQNLAQMLYLSARPVASVTSVAYANDDALVEGTDSHQFAVWPHGLWREDGWDTGSPGWVVRYFGGYWLPSMGTAKPAAAGDIDVAGAHLRRALWVSLQETWSEDREPSPQWETERFGPLSRSRGAGASRLIIPPAARSVFVQEGMPRV